MKYYQELSLQPNRDISLYFLWQKVYQQIHFALVGCKNLDNRSAMGLSFPKYSLEDRCLGNTLRLFATEEQQLKIACLENWLSCLEDYLHLTAIYPVPTNLSGHACFKRVRVKGNKEKLARRRAKRKGETFSEALTHFPDYQESTSNLLYINLSSGTTGQKFRLFIEKELAKESQIGWYSCYGLSHTSTVPLF